MFFLVFLFPSFFLQHLVRNPIRGVRDDMPGNIPGPSPVLWRSYVRTARRTTVAVRPSTSTYLTLEVLTCPSPLLVAPSFLPQISDGSLSSIPNSTCLLIPDHRLIPFCPKLLTSVLPSLPCSPEQKAKTLQPLGPSQVLNDKLLLWFWTCGRCLEADAFVGNANHGQLKGVHNMALTQHF